ncbi:MAG: thioredoxin family protein [Bacteroidetes bacterium]|nr:thioredoxin family protein [Bacteroidota bacterium]
MRKTWVLFIVTSILIFQGELKAQTDSVHIYNPSENAQEGIDHAIALAKQQNKHVFIQAGGNWCIWCLRFNKFVNQDVHIDSVLKKNYIIYHLNYSKENMNKPVFEKYGFAQRFGFPVFIILDGDGKLLHIQNSAYLEQGNGYSEEKVLDFLNNWTPAVFNPANYQ